MQGYSAVIFDLCVIKKTKVNLVKFLTASVKGSNLKAHPFRLFTDQLHKDMNQQRSLKVQMSGSVMGDI